MWGGAGSLSADPLDVTEVELSKSLSSGRVIGFTTFLGRALNKDVVIFGYDRLEVNVERPDRAISQKDGDGKGFADGVDEIAQHEPVDVEIGR